jgi:hypothetical protein
MPKARTPELEQERVSKLSKALKQAHAGGRLRTPESFTFKGRHHTADSNTKNKRAHIGKSPVNKGTHATPDLKVKVAI